MDNRADEPARSTTNQVNEIESRTSGRPTSGTVGTGVVVEPFWYDANGNLLFDNRNFYVYDAFNRLVSVRQRGTVHVDTQADELAGTPGDEIAHYYYDGLNRRVRTVSKPGEQDEVQVAHVFGGGAQVLAEYLVSIGGSQPPGGSDVLQRWFVHGQSFPDPLVMVDRTTTVGSSDPAVDDYYWYLKDALGSVGALADANGTIVERYTYEPYGQTHILLPDGTPLIEAIERSFYHDIDFDGMVGASEKASLDACVGSYEPRCLWLHDANQDGHVDATDQAAFTNESTWTSGDDVPVPAMWRRPVQPPFDVADRGSYDLLDYMQFTMCVGEIGVPTTDDFCRILFDVDGDRDVDEYDYSRWSDRFTNPADKYEFPSQSRFGNPLMWTGQRFDADVGLYHFLYRSYSPEIGRWMQRDKLGILSLTVPAPASTLAGAPETPTTSHSPASEYSDGFSLYLYGGASPLINVDALGLEFSLGGLVVRTAIHGALFGGAYTWMKSYSHYSDGGSASNLALATAKGAVGGGIMGAAFGLLGGGIAAALGVEAAVGMAAVSMMVSPMSIGIGIANYVDAETYADRVMGAVDIGLGSVGLFASHIAMRWASGIFGWSSWKSVRRPSVTHPKLLNIMNNLYKGANSPKRIGTGSTADAIRYELRTGRPVYGRWHTVKGRESVNALRNWLRRNPNASESDTTAAKLVKADLESALMGN